MGRIRDTILVVDDEEDIVSTLADYFMYNNYDVMTATNGMEAIEKAGKQPDLILLDIQMAQKDGIETLKEIRAMKDRADIPVIMLTGVEDKDFVLKSAKLGICDYILKPFYSDDLTKRIRKVFAKEEKKQTD